MSKTLTLGSLFDGSGGFPYAAEKVGITPVWASEVSPFPIRVTRHRFPNMKHLGDIRFINGAEIEPVDILTGSSPCTDLSSAGKKTGLQGEHSSLFHDMIRIVNEMREATNGEYPRYIVWENVRGALNRHKGADFYTIIEELCKTANTSIPSTRPQTWRDAGCVLGRNFSLAWRVFDAQFWSLPQIRKRVYAVGCYRPNIWGGGYNPSIAPRILFESEDDPVYPSDGTRAGTNNARCSEECTAESIGNSGLKPPVYMISRAHFHSKVFTNISDTVAASDGKDPHTVYVPVDDSGSSYIARRFTEKEYGKLQGFPPDYCDGLVYEEVSEEDLKFWRNVFAQWCDSRGVKHRSDKQIIKWLMSEPPKSNEYMMWGNGVALPIPEYILGKIVEVENEEAKYEFMGN